MGRGFSRVCNFQPLPLPSVPLPPTLAGFQTPDNHYKVRVSLINEHFYKWTQASTPVAMKALREGPPEVLANICINANLINTPALGDEANIAYTATQLNIAPAQQHGTGQLLVYHGIIALTKDLYRRDIKRSSGRLRWGTPRHEGQPSILHMHDIHL